LEKSAGNAVGLLNRIVDTRPAPPQVAAAAIEVASEQLRKEGRKEGVVQLDESLSSEVGIAVQVAGSPAIYTYTHI
jgi:hypothetical protein